MFCVTYSTLRLAKLILLEFSFSSYSSRADRSYLNGKKSLVPFECYSKNSLYERDEPVTCKVHLRS